MTRIAIVILAVSLFAATPSLSNTTASPQTATAAGLAKPQSGKRQQASFQNLQLRAHANPRK